MSLKVVSNFYSLKGKLSEGDTELKINSNRKGNVTGDGIGEGLTRMWYRLNLVAFRG